LPEPSNYDTILHKARHQMLHAALDELIADFMMHAEQGLTATVGDLLAWSNKQQIDPDEAPVGALTRHKKS
jgi:hypothetical protein